MNIPAGLDFLADLAHTIKVGSGYKVASVFKVKNQNVSDIFDHVGDFELEVIVIGENFPTAKHTIKFRCKSPVLMPLRTIDAGDWGP